MPAQLPNSYSELLVKPRIERLLCAYLLAAVVAELSAAVKQELGYTCSAGIAHTKILAKLASGLHKPAQQTVVPAAAVAGKASGEPRIFVWQSCGWAGIMVPCPSQPPICLLPRLADGAMQSLILQCLVAWLAPGL